MDVADKAATLRAQEHGHQPIICFEPGIAKREGGADRFVNDKCTTIRANMGDNQPAVCYTVDCRNLNLNKEKSGTLQSKNQGGHSLNYQNPVLIEVEDENIPNDNRSIMCEQPSGELHGTGCVQRYAAGVQERL